jgi:arginyl-tRNA synthetase
MEVETLKKYIAEKISSKVEIDATTIMNLFETPNTKFGDLSLPCFKFAKILKKNPVIIASDFAKEFVGDDKFKKVESMDSYINFTFKVE